MSKIILSHLFCVFFLFNNLVKAQDSIYFRNNTIETGKVAQIGQGKVLLQPDTFAQDKILVTYRANKIHKIKYASGRVDTVWGNALYQNTAHIFTNYYLNQRHTLDISLYNLRYSEIRLKYDYYLKKKNLSIAIPLNFTNKNYDGRDVHALLKQRFSSGAILKVFSNPQSKFSFYAGLGILLGYANVYTYMSASNYYQKSNRFFINPIINLGYQHYLNNLIYLAINGTFGPGFYPYHRKLDTSNFTLEIRLGCKIK